MTRVAYLAGLTAFLCLLDAAALSAPNQPPWEELFFQANRAYREGRFQEALEGYTSLVRAGCQNGSVYFNLGNACFRLHQLGPAILHYERARLLIPRDPDLAYNLGYAREQVRDQVPEPEGMAGAGLSWLDALNPEELFWAFAVLNALFWAALLARRLLKTEWTFYLALTLLIVWVAGGLSFGVKCYQLNADRRAVILEEEVSVRAGPDAGDTVLFRLHAGTVVQLERSEEGSSLIRLSEKERGWVNSGSVESVRP